MYHYLLVFLDPKENHKMLGYQAFYGDSIINPEDVVPESKKIEFKLSGYLPDSSINSKYEMLGTPTYDAANNVLLIEFSREMGGINVDVARFDGSDSLTIDLEISKILAVKRQEIFQVIGLFDEDNKFSVIGYVTYFGSMLNDPENDVKFTGTGWVISLDKYIPDHSEYHSNYKRLNCHYDCETKKLSISIPGFDHVSCQMAGYPSKKKNIDEILEEMRKKSIRNAMEYDFIGSLLGIGTFWWLNKAPNFLVPYY